PRQGNARPEARLGAAGAAGPRLVGLGRAAPGRFAGGPEPGAEQQQRAAGAATLAAAPQNAGGASAKANGVEEPPLLARESLEAIGEELALLRGHLARLDEEHGLRGVLPAGVREAQPAAAVPGNGQGRGNGRPWQRHLRSDVRFCAETSAPRQPK
ncbi:unnamed protein product, partial [Effrenium voratum]